MLSANRACAQVGPLEEDRSVEVQFSFHRLHLGWRSRMSSPPHLRHHSLHSQAAGQVPQEEPK